MLPREIAAWGIAPQNFFPRLSGLKKYRNFFSWRREKPILYWNNWNLKNTFWEKNKTNHICSQSNGNRYVIWNFSKIPSYRTMQKITSYKTSLWICCENLLTSLYLIRVFIKKNFRIDLSSSDSHASTKITRTDLLI